MLEYDGCHNIPSFIENFTLILVPNMHGADVLIVIHSPTDSRTCPYVTITRQFPCVCVCVCVCVILKGSGTDTIDVLSCVRREWVCECVCVWIKQLIPRPPERNILSARFSFPVSLWHGEKKKRRVEGGRGIRCPRNRRYGSPVWGYLWHSSYLSPSRFHFLPFFFYYLRFNKAKASSLFCHETFISRL